MATKELPNHGIAYSNHSKASDRRLTRRDVFDLVWSMSLGKAAAILGTTPRGIARFCKLAGLPAPGRGYWRTQRDPTHRPALPEPSIALSDFHLLVKVDRFGVCTRSEALFPITLDAIRSRVLAAIPQCASAIAPRDHQQAKNNQQLRRTRLVDMLSQAAEEIGGRLSDQDDPLQPIVISVGSQSVTLILGTRATPKKARKRPTKTDYLENEFRIAELTTPYAGRVRREWRDTDDQQLEERIFHIFADLIVEAEARCRRELNKSLASTLSKSSVSPRSAIRSSHRNGPRSRKSTQFYGTHTDTKK